MARCPAVGAVGRSDQTMYERKPSAFGLQALTSEDSSMEVSSAASLRAPDLDLQPARDVFQGTLGLIHTALVRHYRLKEHEAAQLERDLCIWFVRFCSRPGSPPPQRFRVLLLVACCRLARSYRRDVGIAHKEKRVSKKASANSAGGRPSRSAME